MSFPPGLIGVPVAFLPVPMPQTAFFADAVPEPTGGAVPAAVAHAVSISATRPLAAHATPSLVFIDLIRSLLRFSSFVGLTTRWSAQRKPPRHADQGLVKCVLLASDTSR